MTPRDLWHYPRTSLAQSMVDALSSGVVHALTLFAPRRMGKTEFLRNDITPLAQEAGYRVFYFSFLDGAADDVAARFIVTLKQFQVSGGIVSSGASKLKGIKKITLAGSTLELNEPTATVSISDILDDLAHHKQPALLLLDEIQELANIPSAAGIVASLRTGLDLNRTTIKTIFTGSSRNGLTSMFDDARAPFFHFSTNIDFPTLDDGFVAHLAAIYKQITKQPIDLQQLTAAFNELGRVPMQMRTLIKDVILDPRHDLTQALSDLKASLQNSQGYGATWAGLSVLDRLLLSYLAHGGHEPYSTDTRQAFSQSIGVKDVSTATIQSTIRRLSRQGHLTKNAFGEYVVNEPNFLVWMLELDGVDATLHHVQGNATI